VLQDLAFWLAVAAVSIASSVLVKILAAKTTSKSFQEFAAAA